MSDGRLPAEVCQLLRGPIATIGHLDTLLALRRMAPLPCPLSELAEAARLPAGPVIRRCVDDLVAAGLVTPLADADAYRFAPRTEALRTHVDALAAAYCSRPTTLVRALYGRTDWR